MTDAMLLREYLDAGSQEAFAELVRRHADWIYHAALRMVRDSHLAEDITQAVFMVLAKNGRKIGRKPVNAWLFGVMRYSAIHALRERKRRQKREQQAAMSGGPNATSSQREIWEELAPQLENAVAHLGRQDRQAVLLRFYQQKSLAEVGQSLGVSEDAARKRVSKAVGELRKMLAAGRSLASAETAEILMWHVTHPIPVKLLAACAHPSAAAMGEVGAIAKGAMNMMLIAKAKIAALILLLLICIPSAVGVALRSATEPVARVSGEAIATPIAPQITSLMMARMRAHRVKSASNLRQIGQYLLLYSNENRGRFPATLGALVPVTDIRMQTFLLPDDSRRPPASATRSQQAEWTDAHSDYTYLTPGISTNDLDPSMIIGSEKKAADGDTGINLLFGDGWVFWFPQDLANQLLKQNDEWRLTANAVPKTEEGKNRRQCAGNLRHIGQMILFYRYNHGGNYPADLNILVKDDANLVLSCPSTIDARSAKARVALRQIDPASTELPAWVYNQTDYIYVRSEAHPGRSDADTVIAYDKDKNHGDGVNILFADEHVRWYPLAQSREIIRKGDAAGKP